MKRFGKCGSVRGAGRLFAFAAMAAAAFCAFGAFPNEWTVEPTLVRRTVLAGQVPQIAGAPLHGTISLTYDDARTTELPTDVGWHVVHAGVEPTAEADGLEPVDFEFFVRFAWADENAGEAFVELKPNPESCTLNDYPVMLRLSAATLEGVDMLAMADGGADLRFYDAAGNELAHDVETFDRNGDSFVWVKVPSYGPEAQLLVMNWGGTRARTTTDAAVWTDYGAVWHMTTASTIPDATGNGLDLTLTGTAPNAPATKASPRGAGVKLAGNMSANDFFGVGVPRDGHTVSFWYYYPDYASGEGYVINKGTWTEEGAYLFLSGADRLRFIPNMHETQGAFATGVNATKAWSFVSIVHASGWTTIYVNGDSKFSAAVDDTKKTTHALTLNAREFDVVRVRKSAATAAEVAVDYRNQQGALSGTMTLVQNVMVEHTLVEVPPVPEEAVYTATEQRPDVPESEHYTVDYGEGDYTSVGEYAITLTLTDPETTAWAGQTTAPKVLKYKILKFYDNGWADAPAFDKPHWVAGEPAGTIVGAAKFGRMSVRYDEARVAEMPLAPGFHVAYCSIQDTPDYAGVAETALCYRVLPAADAGSCKGDLTIRLSGYSGATPLTNFPLLVRLSAARVAGLDMSSFAASKPKLTFHDEEGTRLKHDVERWDPSGESLVWVLVPRVKDNTTRLSMQWQPGRAARSQPADVWGDFAAVWHMNETGTVRTDVSGHGLDLASDAVCTQIAGKVGGATACVGALEGPDFFAAPHNVPKTDFSLSFWYRMPNFAGSERAVWLKGGWEAGGLYFSQRSSSTCLLIPNMNVVPHDGTADCRTEWNYATVSLCGGKARVSVNGRAPNVVNFDAKNLGAFPLVLNSGNHFDEFRVRRAAPSEDWIKADYETQASESFCTYSLIRNARSKGTLVVIQ